MTHKSVWIAAKNNLPEFKKKVLCITRKGEYKILSLDPGKNDCEYKRPMDWQGESVSGLLQRYNFDDVTHWMPLPEKPINKCNFDPVLFKGKATGMFHCPDCGEMVVDGCPHPDYLATRNHN